MNLAAIIVATLSLVIAALTWATSRRQTEEANRIAREALATAQEQGARANRIAEEALATAREHGGEANRLAGEALDDTRAARLEQAWDAVMRSVHYRATYNPGAKEDAPLLREARADLARLVDALPEWQALGDWVQAEELFGVCASQVDFEEMSRQPRHQRPPALAIRWCTEFLANLRRFRRDGYDEPEMLRLTGQARTGAERLIDGLGWGIAPWHADAPEPPGEGGS